MGTVMDYCCLSEPPRSGILRKSYMTRMKKVKRRGTIQEPRSSSSTSQPGGALTPTTDFQILIPLLDKSAAQEDIKQIYQFGKIIGTGKFGTVRMAHPRANTHIKLAVKSIHKRHIKEEQVKFIEDELEILKNVDHPNIISFKEVYSDAQFYHFVMEYVDGGELFERILEFGRFNEKDAAQIIARHMPHMTEPQIIEIANDAAENAPQAEVTPLVPFLTDLRTAGYRLGVSTNDAEHLARAHLQSAHADHLFDFIAGYDSGYGPKPDPGMQIGFCNAMNLPAPSVAMIGDSTHDLIAGRKAGMTTIGVLTGPATAADLEPHADHVLPSIAELPSLLERH